MTEEQVRDRVRAFIVMNFLFGDESEAPADAQSLLESGILDSTGVLELVDFLEDELNTVVADTETVPANLDSIARLTSFVMNKRTSLVA